MKDDGLILVTSIQRFCLHDGPGIRTTVFLKGCMVHCPWCENPENLRPEIESYTDKHGIQAQYGHWMSTGELFREIEKDRTYYEGSGGVTYSGGEALLQANKLEPLMHKLQIEGIGQCIETSLFVDQSALRIAANYIDLFLVDLKILDADQCKRVIGGNFALFYSNLDMLFNWHQNIIFRIPVIPPYTSGKENIKQAVELIRQFRPVSVEILSGHNLGKMKYLSLGKEPFIVPKPDLALLEEYQRRILKLDVPVQICMI